jgi:hypothetical protein
MIPNTTPSSDDELPKPRKPPLSDLDEHRSSSGLCQQTGTVQIALRTVRIEADVVPGG